MKGLPNSPLNLSIKGEYECAAQNEHGRTVKKGTLTVVDTTTIETVREREKLA